MTARLAIFFGLAAASLLALAGCGSREKSDPSDGDEEAGLELAIAAPMMVDPDLTTRNLANAAIAGGGPPTIVLPPISRRQEDIAAAKAEADRLVGGSVGHLPEAEGAVDPALRDAVTALQRATAVGPAASNCAAKADYALGWSLRLPMSLPIYPRGNLTEAAGSDRDGCSLRAVRFLTPVDPESVMAFYNARAAKAGFAPSYRSDETTFQLRGGKGTGEFAVQARKREDGLTEADIAVNGI
jgi:hypothetical protein